MPKARTPMPSSAKFRARYRRTLAEKQRAEERTWAAQSGPVRSWVDLSLLKGDSQSE